MTEDFLRKLQAKTIETLKFSIEFFEKHNLRYYAYGGTCLGTVRHHGMIPWDDDVDLVMPHEDYEKLISLQKEIDSSGGFRLLTPDTPGYYDPICRITNTDITLWRYYMNPIVFGAQVDIFPLDRTDEDDATLEYLLKEYHRKTARYQRANQKYPWVRFKENIQHRHLRGLLRNIKWALSTHNVNRYKRELEALKSTLHNPDGRRYVSFGSYINGMETYPLEWFSSYIEMPFADFMIRVPQGYDGYLKYVYGDYMQLPPKEKQKPAHSGYYMNLSEGLTIDEVRRRLKQGEKYVL